MPITISIFHFQNTKYIYISCIILSYQVLFFKVFQRFPVFSSFFRTVVSMLLQNFLEFSIFSLMPFPEFNQNGGFCHYCLIMCKFNVTNLLNDLAAFTNTQTNMSFQKYFPSDFYFEWLTSLTYRRSGQIHTTGQINTNKGRWEGNACCGQFHTSP